MKYLVPPIVVPVLLLHRPGALRVAGIGREKFEEAHRRAIAGGADECGGSRVRVGERNGRIHDGLPFRVETGA